MPQCHSDMREYVCFKQRGNISTVNVSSLKLSDKITYPGSSVDTAIWMHYMDAN